MAPRILVVSPEWGQRSAWADLLCKHGLESCQADSVASALDYLALHAVDVILADATLPAEGALDLSRQLYGRGAPSVLILGQDDVIGRVVAVEIGADDVLPRDIDGRELIARVRALARRRAFVGETRRAGGWRARSSVRVLEAPNGKVLALSAIHWDLLMLMVRTSGQPIDAQRAAAAIPSFRDNPDGALRTAVSRLRRKMSDKFGSAPISNYYGFGYVLDVPVSLSNDI
ncbi:response regulator [Roseibacterium beibuensis]|uniref:response regulator transcription factor n=1 Tax=[Roseibacterium] beibuensis TaxID=1193142 RepID=UPI00217E07D6|nr:response regulator [Roseibacterium beibuensis]MCS6625426.1 response regulator [Roseibacterium beibuensis]